MIQEDTPDQARADNAPPAKDDRRDILTGAVTGGAILMVIASAWNVIQQVMASLHGHMSATDNVVVTALLLNVALSLLGWQRYRELKREVARRKSAEERANQLAACDPLTGFLNRRSLNESGNALIAHAIGRHRAVAMLMIDLDHFKTVNDMYGHSVGDLLLRDASAAIAKPLPTNSLTARLGGDEFACAFSFDPAHPAMAESIAEEIITRLSEPFQLNGIQVNIGASLGIARTDTDCRSIEALMRRSDIAMYAAKRAGRNRHIWFDASMERELELRNEIERGLRAGLPLGEVVPYYEQQIDLTTGKLVGFEVLARWEHPLHGVVQPNLFIPIAEESGLIGELSMNVMRQAFLEARQWDRSLLLSVNISPAQMRDPWLAQKLVKLLTETRFPPDRLEIEITEAALYDNLGLAQSIIGSLKNQGIRISLDDFGTGYSSLTHLRALPLDRIKIDRSFVSAMAQDPDSAAIVHTITTLAQSLKVAVTAEGVETEAVLQMLNEIGCPQGQGWHFGKPMTTSATRALLRERGLIYEIAAPVTPTPTTQNYADPMRDHGAI